MNKPMPKATNPMPKIAMMPPPPPRKPDPMHQEYSEEAARVAQRHFDQVAEITRLTDEVADWRGQYLAEKLDRERLEQRLAQEELKHEDIVARMTRDFESKSDELERQRNVHSHRIVRLETKFETEGKAVLDLAQAVGNLASSVSRQILGSLDELKGERPAPDVAGTLGLAAIADAIEEKPAPAEEAGA